MSGRIVDHAAARRAALVAAVWVPLAIVVVAEAIIIAVGVTGPATLIVHWGDGPDRMGPWWTYAVLVAAIGFPVIAVIGVFIARATRMSGMNTWMPAIALGITVFHAVGMGVGSVVLNASALTPALPLGGGGALAIAVALLTWWLLPREAPADARVRSADALPIRRGEVAAWTGRVELPTGFVVAIAGIAAVMIVVGVVLLLNTGRTVWPIFVAPAVLLVTLIVTAQFVVTAGPAGLTVRSPLGWPRLGVRAADIATAGVVEVDPMAEFGGWGIRWAIGPGGKGRWGVVMHRGPALEVVRRDGRSVLVTVADAATAASVLEAYAPGSVVPPAE